MIGGGALYTKIIIFMKLRENAKPDTVLCSA